MKIDKRRKYLTKFADEVGDPSSKTLIEIGCYTGESTAVWSDLFLKVIAIDPFTGGYDDTDICSRENGPDISRQFLDLVFDRDNIEFWGNTPSNSPRLSDVRGHVVYIDGCHLLESVTEDITIWKSRAKSVGGHDYNLQPVREAVCDLLGPPDFVFGDNSWLRL